jgi:2-methylcitrate dehydratase PrpD
VLEGAGGYRPHNEAGWHSTGTCGSFGAAAGAAKLLGLGRERFADALGVAGTFTGGTWAYLADGAMTKRFHPGKAAENGLSAAFLAQAGLTGPRHVLEAEWGGFFPTYSRDNATPEATLAGLGQEFRILESGMKPYACCRTLHACIDSVFEIMAEARSPSSAIVAIRAHGNAQTKRQFDRKHIASLFEAQFSMAYCLAVAAESRSAGLDQFLPLRTGEPEIARLMAVTEIIPDRELGTQDYPAVEIAFADGRRFERQIRFAKGAPENPLTEEELMTKAVSLVEPVLGRRRADELASRVLALEESEDFRVVAGLLRPASRASILA